MQHRVLVPADLELICRHRAEMFREAGRAHDVLETMTDHFRPWLAQHLASGTYFGFVLEEQGEVAAGIGLMVLDWPPHPAHATQARRGYVLNVYVEPQYRRRGVGRQLMALAEREFEARALQCAILHATELGRGLYEELGWSATTEMSKRVGG